LKDINKGFFIAAGESPLDIAPVPLPRFIEYNDSEFILIWKRKKIKICN